MVNGIRLNPRTGTWLVAVLTAVAATSRAEPPSSASAPSEPSRPVFVFDGRQWIAQPETPTASNRNQARTPTASRPVKVRARALATAMVYASIIFITLMVGIVVILRFTRRFRAALLRPEGKPTAYTDAWSQHKPPDELPDDDDIRPAPPAP